MSRPFVNELVECKKHVYWYLAFLFLLLAIVMGGVLSFVSKNRQRSRWEATKADFEEKLFIFNCLNNARWSSWSNCGEWNSRYAGKAFRKRELGIACEKALDVPRIETIDCPLLGSLAQMGEWSAWIDKAQLKFRIRGLQSTPNLDKVKVIQAAEKLVVVHLKSFQQEQWIQYEYTDCNKVIYTAVMTLDDPWDWYCQRLCSESELQGKVPIKLAHKETFCRKNPSRDSAFTSMDTRLKLSCFSTDYRGCFKSTKPSLISVEQFNTKCRVRAFGGRSESSTWLKLRSGETEIIFDSSFITCRCTDPPEKENGWVFMFPEKDFCYKALPKPVPYSAVDSFSGCLRRRSSKFQELHDFPYFGTPSNADDLYWLHMFGGCSLDADCPDEKRTDVIWTGLSCFNKTLFSRRPSYPDSKQRLNEAELANWRKVVSLNELESKCRAGSDNTEIPIASKVFFDENDVAQFRWTLREDDQPATAFCQRNINVP